jgi:hypothetical protein
MVGDPWRATEGTRMGADGSVLVPAPWCLPVSEFGLAKICGAVAPSGTSSVTLTRLGTAMEEHRLGSRVQGSSRTHLRSGGVRESGARPPVLGTSHWAVSPERLGSEGEPRRRLPGVRHPHPIDQGPGFSAVLCRQGPCLGGSCRGCRATGRPPGKSPAEIAREKHGRICFGLSRHQLPVRCIDLCGQGELSDRRLLSQGEPPYTVSRETHGSGAERDAFLILVSPRRSCISSCTSVRQFPLVSHCNLMT